MKQQQDQKTTKLQDKALEVAKALYTAGHQDDDLGNQLQQLCDAAAREKIDLLQALDKLESWLLCAAITTPEDMAQSFPDMLTTVSDALAKAKE